MSRLLYSTLKSFKKVTHVIFDLDGLLLDTETIYKNVMTQIAKEHGKEYTPQIRLKVLGRPDHVGCEIATKELQISISSKSLLEEYRKRSSKLLKSCPLMPGAKELVEHLHYKSVPIAIATSSGEEGFKRKTAIHKDFFSLFDHIVTGGTDPEVKRGKPNPDIYLVCAARFSDTPKPSQCLAFEDSPNGVESAITAGMQCVMVPEEIMPDRLTRNATQVLKSLLEFKPEKFGLPSY